LHDDTIQALIVASRNLDDLAAGNSKLSAGEIREEIRKIIEGLRRFSQELRPSVLDDLGLIPAVKWLAADLEKNSDIRAAAEVTGSQRSLPPEKELMLFRIIQEALTNIRRHSGANTAAVKIDYDQNQVILIIRDNGQGFEPPPRLSELARTGKLGLAGMTERVQLLGGTLHIESRPGQGTELTIVVPA
jgi:signal transduction histidine kinase